MRDISQEDRAAIAIEKYEVLLMAEILSPETPEAVRRDMLDAMERLDAMMSVHPGSERR